MDQVGFISMLGELLDRLQTEPLGIIGWVVLAVILLVLIALLVLLSKRQAGATPAAHSFERMGGFGGKLERLEKELNDFKTDAYRNIEFLKARVEELEQGKTETLSPVETSSASPQDAGAAESSGERSATGVNVADLGWDGPDQRTQEALDQKSPESESEGVSESGRERRPTQEHKPNRRRETADINLKVTKEEEAAAEEVLPSGPESLSKRLSSTRLGLLDKIRSVFSSKPRLDDEMLEEIEVLLVTSDLGVKMTESLIEDVKGELSGGSEVDEGMLTGLLKMKILKILEEEAPLNPAIQPVRRSSGPSVVMVVGVNGVGKTTTAAKLAREWRDGGARVLLVAADTFRAAAVDQLVTWGERINVPVVRGEENAKPSTVVFDAMERAVNENFDVVLIDTAGRLHTKSNLMQELEGVRNVIKRHQEDAPHEVVLVVDGTTGQNAISQAREFNNATPLTGLIITKLDGTPKGGIVVAIKDELGIPVRYIGVGEGEYDLRPFVGRDFVEALFDTSTPDSDDPSEHGRERRQRRVTSEYKSLRRSSP